MNSTPQTDRERIAELERQVARLARKLEQTDTFAGGIVSALAKVLPPLLRNQPEVALDVLKALEGSEQRALLARTTGDQEKVHLYDAGKILHELMRRTVAGPSQRSGGDTPVSSHQEVGDSECGSCDTHRNKGESS